MNTTTLNETCGCGASFSIATTVAGTARVAADEWRENHKHAESVGICGNQPPPLMLDGVAMDRLYLTPHCTLKAGHAGLHSDGDGNWTDRAAECDHPRIEHGLFSHTGICPGCRKCKFIGHGPLCVDCYATQPPTDPTEES